MFLPLTGTLQRLIFFFFVPFSARVNKKKGVAELTAEVNQLRKGTPPPSSQKKNKN